MKNALVGIIIISTILFFTVLYGASLKTLTPIRTKILNFNELDRIEKILTKVERVGYNNSSPSEQDIYNEYIIQPPYQTVGDGDNWYNAGGPDKYRASSFLQSQGNNKYHARMGHDWNLKTAWIEGKKDYGIGEYIEFSFPLHPYANTDAPRVTHIIVYNGYQKSQYVWEGNSRVKKLKLYINGTPYAYLALRDQTGSQSFKIEPVRSVKGKLLKIRLEIVDVYPGKKWKDVALSEVNFDGLDVLCFTKDTLITMANGSLKKISRLKEGEKILSYNTSLNAFEIDEIVSLASVNHSNLIKIYFNDGSSIVSTDDHPYLSTRGWISKDVSKGAIYGFDNIQEMQIGDAILDSNGSKKIINDIKTINENKMTYTITKLKKNNAFIANDVIVGVEEIN